MSAYSLPDISLLLQKIGTGDTAATSELVSVVYAELRRVAGRLFCQERPDHTLQPTALVNELYIRLCESGGGPWQNRAHFFGAAARSMRQILVEHARSHGAIKRGGAYQKVELSEADCFSLQEPADLLAVNEALSRLADRNPVQCEIVQLKIFAGFSSQEIADLLMMGESTVRLHWTMAKAWLRNEVSYDVTSLGAG
jgi:RNA polymerase sigma-70 factor, ECF subfamily